MFDEVRTKEAVRELIDARTLRAKLPEGEACQISAEICEDLASEYQMRADELAEES